MLLEDLFDEFDGALRIIDGKPGAIPGGDGEVVHKGRSFLSAPRVRGKIHVYKHIIERKL